MDNSELEETVRALYGLCITQDGMLQAQQAILNAVIGGIGTTLPQTLNATAEGLTQLEALYGRRSNPAPWQHSKPLSLISTMASTS